MHKIVFFGSGSVAAESLKNLHKNYDIELIITKKRPFYHKDPAPVETFATKHNLNIEFADTRSELEHLIIAKKIKSHCGIVIDYGVIISKAVIKYFAKGIVNSHFSVLPEWRGADPISFAILSGQQSTGVSLMTIDEGLDTGKIIASCRVPILPCDTGWTLTNKLIESSDDLINQELPKYLSNNLTPYYQPNKIITYSIKLQKKDNILDWQKPATVLAREIRAYQEWPKSRCKINNIDLIIVKAKAVEIKLLPGEISINKNLIVGCRVGSLQILELRPAGKKTMDVESFINGYSVFSEDKAKI